jgi:hypothetical protein
MKMRSHATKSRPRPWRVKRIVDLCVLLFFIGAAVLAVGGAAGVGWMWGWGVAEVLSLNELAGQIVGTLLGTIAGIGLLGIAYYDWD